MSETLTITKERVLAAAETCPDVKRALKAIFPEVFEDTSKVIKPFDITQIGSDAVVYLPTDQVTFALSRVQTSGDVSFVVVRFSAEGKLKFVQCYAASALAPVEKKVDSLKQVFK